MRKLFILIAILAALCVLGKCAAQTMTSPNDLRFCSSGSKYASTITPVGFELYDLESSNRDVYMPVQVRKLPGINDPFLEPVEDVPVIFTIAFLAIYVLWWRKEKGGI